jgi:hypothetical protein
VLKDEKAAARRCLHNSLFSGAFVRRRQPDGFAC